MFWSENILYIFFSKNILSCYRVWDILKRDILVVFREYKESFIILRIELLIKLSIQFLFFFSVEIQRWVQVERFVYKVRELNFFLKRLCKVEGTFDVKIFYFFW